MKKEKRELKKAAAETAAAAGDLGHSAWEEAVNKASKIFADTQKRVGPYAKSAKTKTADFASKRLDAWEPHIQSALDKISPAVDAARDKVADDYLPKLQGLLHDAAEHPVAQEADKRRRATMQALKGELEPVKRKSKLKTFGKVLGIGAIIAGAVAAVRHFLTPKDDGWTAHEPSRAYVNNTANFAAGTPSTATDAPVDGVEVQTDEDDVQVVPEEEIEEQTKMTSEGAPPPAEPVVTHEDLSENTSTFGEGSYVGENPPEGFTIKGNERSKKYHVPGGNGYDRTIAEVWFNSEEAAEAAGFSKAQR